MPTQIESLKPTIAELQQLYRDLSKLENDLRDAGGNLDEVRQHKAQVWRDMAARNLVAGPVEQLFYRIQSAPTPEILNSLAGEILAIKCTKDEASELMWEYQQRAEQFADEARAIRNN